MMHVATFLFMVISLYMHTCICMRHTCVSGPLTILKDSAPTVKIPPRRNSHLKCYNVIGHPCVICACAHVLNGLGRGGGGGGGTLYPSPPGVTL